MAAKKTTSDIEASARRSRSAMLQVTSPTKRERPATEAVTADIWVVYAREDGALAGALIEQLRTDGLLASWDREMPPGVDYDFHIEQAIRQCRKTIAIWSSAALQSRFVLDEATLALELGKLIPVHAPDYDTLSLPMRFRRLQSTPVAEYALLLAALRA
jgi:hypothetical protein